MRRIKAAPVRRGWPLGLVSCLLVSGTIGMHAGRSIAATEHAETANMKPEPPPADTAYLPVPRGTWTLAAGYSVQERYEIRQGDTLLHIAGRFNTDVETLQNLNPELDPEGLIPGTEIIVVPNFRGLAYTVEDGDTIEDIAARYEMAAVDIVTFNDVGAELAPGSTLLLPGVRPRVPENLIASRSGSRSEVVQVAAAPVPEPAPPPPPPPPPPAPVETDNGWVWPLRRILLFSEFGNRGGGWHAGLDMAAPQGTPVYAARSGTVSFAGWHNGYGYYVDIDHGDGMVTRYAHASGLEVQTGDWVNAGDVIMYVGSTGNSTGPHLHFEVIVDGVAVNPRNYLP